MPKLHGATSPSRRNQATSLPRKSSTQAEESFLSLDITVHDGHDIFVDVQTLSQNDTEKLKRMLSASPAVALVQFLPISYCVGVVVADCR